VVTAQPAELPLPGGLRSAAAARRHTRAWLQTHNCPVDGDTAEQLVSELVANALLHTGGRVIGLRLTRHHDRIRAEVRDPSRALPCFLPPGPTTPSGRGMFLVDQMAHRWGVDLLPIGKYVWFELRLPPGRIPYQPARTPPPRRLSGTP
jgi:anti-sigma regulatory factor (Ser/Thr protein kinase)